MKLNQNPRNLIAKSIKYCLSSIFQLSRSAVYLHLLPRKSNTTEGKRHISTVPVRLKRALNDAHRSHVDTKFCVATIRYLEELASLLGPDQVLFISQDDKVRTVNIFYKNHNISMVELQ